MTRELRVGIIGANARGGWAGEAHVPAIRAVPGLVLAAVATSRQDSADEAAHVFGAGRAYAGGLALIADPAIDVVTVATRVPDHRDLLLAAVAAGKHVYSEWPLGRGSADSAEIAAAAGAAGVRHAIGLQLRESPAVRRARGIIASGALGRVLSVNVVSTTAGFGPEVRPQFAYLEDPAAFANMITIQAAHTLDLLIALGGGIASFAAQASRQFPRILVGGEQKKRERTTFDHLLLQGRFTGGAPFTMEVAGGRRGETPFYLDLIGENGRLRLEGGAPRGVQSGRLSLLRDGESEALDAHEEPGIPDSAVNVAGVYRALRDDILHGTSTATGFSHAEALSHLVEDVLRASDAGTRTGGGCWPDR